MVVLIGCILVLAAVLTGFSMAGGHVASLIHPSEFITIGGAALGALVVMSPAKVLKDLGHALLQLLKGSPYNKALYTELFKLMYEFQRLVRRDGLLTLEVHITNPEESDLFRKYPQITGNHHVLEFLTGSFALICGGKSDPGEVGALLEKEIAVYEREHHDAVDALTRTADALPGFGIVAAVLGIVVTMQAIGGPAEEIGHKVGTALVGTFLGILMSYGFFGPMAGRMEHLGAAETEFLRTVSSIVVASTGSGSPKEVLGQVRRGLPTDCRPTLAELEEIFKSVESAA